MSEMRAAGVSEKPSYEAEVAERQPPTVSPVQGSSCMQVEVTTIYSLHSWRGPGRRCMLSQGFKLIPATGDTLTLPLNASSLPGGQHALRLPLKQLCGKPGV